MAWISFVAILLAIVGTAGMVGYALGHRHGADDQMSQVLDGFYRRETPEPPRLRVFHPVYDQDRTRGLT